MFFGVFKDMQEPGTAPAWHPAESAEGTEDRGGGHGALARRGIELAL